jgi:16S rRNA (cytosine1402-N4)-methyltransferase
MLSLKYGLCMLFFITSYSSYCLIPQKFALPSIHIQPLQCQQGNSDTSTNKPAYKRRVRYSGKYPKTFTEKYKEINDQEDVIQKVLSKGSTPAGQHVPVMLEETVAALNISHQHENILVDCTLGYGSHTLRMFRQAELNCRIVAFDRDAIELKKTTMRIENLIYPKCDKLINPSSIPRADLFHPIHDSFAHLSTHLSALGYHGQVHGIIADLGLSSMQIDDPIRGFTYKSNGPLDMRMDGNQSTTAMTVLKQQNPSGLAQILAINSDEPYAMEIAEAIYGDKNNLPSTTLELAECVRNGLRRAHREHRLATPTKADFELSIKRTMQAIRIEVNQEFQALDQLLASIPACLRSGGRVAILTFHSGR